LGVDHGKGGVRMSRQRRWGVNKGQKKGRNPAIGPGGLKLIAGRYCSIRRIQGVRGRQSGKVGLSPKYG